MLKEAASKMPAAKAEDEAPAEQQQDPDMMRDGMQQLFAAMKADDIDAGISAFRALVMGCGMEPDGDEVPETPPE